MVFRLVTNSTRVACACYVKCGQIYARRCNTMPKRKLGDDEFTVVWCPKRNSIAYDHDGRFPDQEEKYQRHIFEAKTTNVPSRNKIVPPWSTSWPVDNFPLADLTPIEFIRHLVAFPSCISTMKEELDIEAQAQRLTKITSDTLVPVARGLGENKKFGSLKRSGPHWEKQLKSALDQGLFWSENFSENVTWAGWSAGLQLEVNMESFEYRGNDLGVTKQCTSFFQCLVSHELRRRQLSFEESFNVREAWLKKHIPEVLEFARELNSLVGLVLTDAFVGQNPNYNKSIFKAFNDILAQEGSWLQWLQKEDPRLRELFQAQLSGHLKQIPSVVTRNKEIADDRLRDSLFKPALVYEVDLIHAFRVLIDTVYEGDGKVVPHYKRKLGNVGPFLENGSSLENERCAAGLLLCQLATGSRARGIIAVNIMERVDVKLAEKNSSGLGDSWNLIKKTYDVQPNELLTVRRLTKSVDPGVKAVFDYMKTAKVSDELLDDLEVMDMDTEITSYREKRQSDTERVITKPLLYPLFDLQTYFRSMPQSELARFYYNERQSTIDVFMDLFSRVRQRVLAPMQKEDKQVVGEDKQITVIDSVIKSPKTTVVVKFWTTAMNKLIKIVFPAGTNTGSHDMRRIYVAYGYELFAKNTMKETGWANRVLAHDSVHTSTIYTSLKIVMGTKGEKRDPTDALVADVAALRKEVARLIKLIGAVDPDVVADEKEVWRNPDDVAFIDRDGREVFLSKLPRMKRGDSVELKATQEVDRARVAGQMLFDANVSITCSSLEKLGIPKTAGKCKIALRVVDNLVQIQKR